MTMKRFDPKADRDAPMTHIVSFHNVPLYRGTAFMLWLIERHGAPISIASGIRVDSVIQEHNRLFKTNLHGQQWCIDMHKAHPAQYAAANPPNRTSHCGFSDGNAAYKVDGKQIPPGGRLPWYMWGVDFDDRGKNEDNSHAFAVGRELGFKLVRPYKVGSETHHAVNEESPIAVLEKRNVISKNRQS